MKIALLNDSCQEIGGGWTFLGNLSKGLEKLGQTVVENPFEAQVALIPGATMVKRDTVQELKAKGVKVVLRIDNVPRNSRNRNTGTFRLKDFGEWADEVVWQCQWAKDYLIDFIKKEGVIIYNGIDTEIFKPEGARKEFKGEPVYLYSRYNRDETKNWEVAWYEYQLIHRENPKALLVLVGKFSPELQEYNYDFFRGERVEALGIVNTAEEMAQIYRGCRYLLATYYNDCFSNTYLEALACGVELYHINMSGGTPEMLNLFIKYGVDYFKVERMAKDYVSLFETILKNV
jgi:glycosyltransferase involved in cell wall biosynthesis